MKILGNGERGCKRGPEAWFSGMAWMDSVVEPTAPAKGQAVLVTFAPGARTAWHAHPLGQTLYVVSGLGWAQKEGEAAMAIRPGDVVAIPAGENHWHGAEAGHTMVHLAMQENDEAGVNVVWGRQVSEEEYGAVPAGKCSRFQGLSAERLSFAHAMMLAPPWRLLPRPGASSTPAARGEFPRSQAVERMIEPLQSA